MKDQKRCMSKITKYKSVKATITVFVCLRNYSSFYWVDSPCYTLYIFCVSASSQGNKIQR